MTKLNDALEEIIDERLDSWWDGIDVNDSINWDRVEEKIRDNIDYGDIAGEVDLDEIKDKVLEDLDEDELFETFEPKIRQMIKDELKSSLEELVLKLANYQAPVAQ